MTADFADALIASSPDGLLLVDAAGSIVLANPTAAALFGRTADALVGLPVEVLVPSEHRARHVRHRDGYAAAPTARPMGSGLRLLAEHADGTLFPVEISLSPISLDGERHTIATVRDVSERQDARAHAALMDERERIARDLHDTVIQELFAAGMTLEAIAATIDPPSTGDRVRDVIGQLDDVIRQIRNSIHQLGQVTVDARPSSRLAELIDDRAAHLGFAPRLRIEGELDDLPDELAEQLLATASEALSNVVRHAGASAVLVDVRASDPVLSLEVHDDGVGLPRRPATGRGLANMSGRAADLGGRCTLEPADGGGTVLRWQVPLRR